MQARSTTKAGSTKTLTRSRRGGTSLSQVRLEDGIDPSRGYSLSSRMGKMAWQNGAVEFSARVRLPPAFYLSVKRHALRFSEHVMLVSVRRQRIRHFGTLRDSHFVCPQNFRPSYFPVGECLISTSRFGIGQTEGSHRTPLGLHRVAEKIGGGWPAGTVFKSRVAVGFCWRGMPDAKITSRILWLEGLEPGLNRGGKVDSHARYIYIHGTADEPALGTPTSCGCIHVAAKDLIPLFDEVPVGTLVWIEP